MQRKLFPGLLGTLQARSLAGTLACLAVLAAAPAAAAGTGVVAVPAALETPALFDDDAGGNADGDDPAIWAHPWAEGSGLVIATKKDAGLSVYDLSGRERQAVAAPPAPDPGDAPGRFNNVDLLYGAGPGGADIAVVSDRGHDRLRIYTIDPHAARRGAPPLRDVTAAGVPFLFSADQSEVNEEATAYGLATWLDRSTGRRYATVSRNNHTTVAMAELVTTGGRVGYRVVDTIDLPHTFTLPDGTAWRPCGEPGELPQVEGMVVDRERGILYAAQEDVGIWRIPVRGGLGSAQIVDRVREYGVPWTYDAAADECVVHYEDDPGYGGRHLSADAEGLTIYYAGDREGYLLASGQGDDTFTVYDREPGNAFVGAFTVSAGRTDGVQESDGADVLNVDLGDRFDEGLLVVHDGRNTPDVTGPDGEPRANTDFKFVPWDAVAGAFPDELTVDPDGWDPRD
ncbi:phytase [Spirillospora sp. NPDC029432]|uniref:phytase n=1 Tax=Spirillospora sp. NPDC029432 TaxID=3154599 RepID=UPI00345663EB